MYLLWFLAILHHRVLLALSKPLLLCMLTDLLNDYFIGWNGSATDYQGHKKAGVKSSDSLLKLNLELLTANDNTYESKLQSVPT